MEKELKIDLYNFLLIFINSTFLRFFFIKNPLDADTFFYINGIIKGSNYSELLLGLGSLMGYFKLEFLISGLCISLPVLFYFLCRRYTNQLNSLLVSLLFCFSPIIYLNSYLEFMDKNILCLYLIILLLLIDTIRNRILKWFLIAITFIVFSYAWQLWYIVAIFYVIFECVSIYFDEMSNDTTKLLIAMTFIFTFVFLLTRIYTLLMFYFNNIDKSFTAELVPIWNVMPSMDYLIIVFAYLGIILIMRKYKAFWYNHTKEICLFFYFLIATIFVFRISIFLMVLSYLMLAIILHNMYFNPKWLKMVAWTILIFLIALPSISDYQTKSFITRSLVLASDYTRSQDTHCIIGMWDKGHFYEFWTIKTALYKATPNAYKDMLDYMVYGKPTNCSIIYSNQDLKGIMYMNKSLNYSDIYVYNTNTKVFIDVDTNINYYVLEVK